MAYLFAGFYLTVMSTIAKLDEASKRMVSGNLDALVDLDNRDELGQVVQSFNTIATRLRAEWAQAQEESTRARRAEAALREKTAFVQLLQIVAAAANEAATAEDAMQIALDQVCAYTGWPVGHVYLLAAEGADALAPTSVWRLEDPERFATFRAMTEATPLPRGKGLPG